MLVKIFGTLDWESTKDSSGGHDTENLNLWYLVPKIFYGVNVLMSADMHVPVRKKKIELSDWTAEFG